MDLHTLSGEVRCHYAERGKRRARVRDSVSPRLGARSTSRQKPDIPTVTA
ncbi:hypothetical protein A176_005899 [Myxococcus hansupus]|uniref:Uncharacterized protein n=1 Tax=Pseudomyxococcus hansupus TaxID=1297742 RepID=A0A0H4XL75_9BACT|nr:hypothetical protein A176_005899 [Myxococcus hansupus]